MDAFAFHVVLVFIKPYWSIGFYPATVLVFTFLRTTKRYYFV